MKKLFSLALIATVSFVLVGCQKSDEKKVEGAAADVKAAGADAAKGATDALKK